MFKNGSEYEERCVRACACARALRARGCWHSAGAGSPRVRRATRRDTSGDAGGDTLADAWDRLRRPYAPPTVTLKEIHAAVPKHLLEKSALRSTGYVLRDVLFCAACFAFGRAIEPLVATRFAGLVPAASPLWHPASVRAALWVTYWWWQGIAFTSFFCIGACRRLRPPSPPASASALPAAKLRGRQRADALLLAPPPSSPCLFPSPPRRGAAHEVSAPATAPVSAAADRPGPLSSATARSTRTGGRTTSRASSSIRCVPPLPPPRGPADAMAAGPPPPLAPPPRACVVARTLTIVAAQFVLAPFFAWKASHNAHHVRVPSRPHSFPRRVTRALPLPLPLPLPARSPSVPHATRSGRGTTREVAR